MTLHTSRCLRVLAVVAGVLTLGVTGAARLPTTLLVSVNRTGTASGDGDSLAPVLSASGRWVAFASDASDLVAHDTNGAEDVFVRPLPWDEP